MANDTFNFNTFLTDLGQGLGNFLTAIQGPVVYFVVVLGIAAAVTGLIYAVVHRIRKGMN